MNHQYKTTLQRLLIIDALCILLQWWIATLVNYHGRAIKGTKLYWTTNSCRVTVATSKWKDVNKQLSVVPESKQHGGRRAEQKVKGSRRANPDADRVFQVIEGGDAEGLRLGGQLLWQHGEFALRDS